MARASVFAIASLTLLVRLLTVPDFVESVDGWAFVRGVERYAVFESRPHWPGYPAYVALGKLFALLAGDAAHALHLLSVVGSSLSVWPLMVLAREWTRARVGDDAAAQRAAWATGTLWALAPLSWLAGCEILSDPPALFLGLLVLLCSWRSISQPGRAASWLCAGAALAGLMLGTRLAYVPLVLPWAYAAFHSRRCTLAWRGRSVPAWLPAASLMALCVATWLLWQVNREGSLFLSAAELRLGEHFGSWQRRVLAHQHWWLRPLWLLKTLVVFGLGGWWPGLSLARLVATILVAWLGLRGMARLFSRSSREVSLLFLLFVAPYLLSVLLGQDVSLARYSLPLVAVSCVAIGAGLPRGARQAGFTILFLGLMTASVSTPLVLLRRTSPPLGDQVARYLASSLDQRTTTLLVTDDAPYVATFLEELAPSFHFALVDKLDLTRATRLLEAEGRSVYSTAPPPDLPEQWSVAAQFTRDRFLESRGPLSLRLYRHQAYQTSK